MRFTLTIATKLTIAYALFLMPIVYLGVRTVSGNEHDIAFARKELLGVHYVSVVRAIQDAVIRGADMAALAGRVGANERAQGRDLATADAAAALTQALAGVDRAAAAQAAAALIGKAADGSNLTLDPDLDSFYTQDALTVKIPAAIAGFAAVAANVAASTGRDLAVADQVKLGVGIGALQPGVDGLVADIGSATAGNPDKSVDRAMGPAIKTVTGAAKIALAALADHAEAANAFGITLPVLDALAAAGDADCGEVAHLLTARIAGFRRAERMSGGVAAALFLMAVTYVIVVVQRGAIRPLRALTEAMRRLAARDLTVSITGMARGDEVGAMARALHVFKDNMNHAEGRTARRRRRKTGGRPRWNAIRRISAVRLRAS
jgi:methyl-accepting chemotaxis protein